MHRAARQLYLRLPDAQGGFCVCVLMPTSISGTEDEAAAKRPRSGRAGAALLPPFDPPGAAPAPRDRNPARFSVPYLGGPGRGSARPRCSARASAAV